MAIEMLEEILDILLFIGALAYLAVSYQRWKDIAEALKQIRQVMKKLEGAVT